MHLAIHFVSSAPAKAPLAKAETLNANAIPAHFIALSPANTATTRVVSHDAEILQGID